MSRIKQSTLYVILYAIAIIFAVISAIFLGSITINDTINSNRELKVLRNTGNGLELILSNGTAVHVSNIDMEKNNYIDTKNIIDWNTDGKELSVLTENDYEFYAYKDKD